MLARLQKTDDIGMFRQNRFYAAPQTASSLSVHDANLVNSLFPASLNIIWHELADVLRAKGVQVEFAVDRHFDRSFKKRFVWLRTHLKLAFLFVPGDVSRVITCNSMYEKRNPKRP